jgi:NADPH-dependent ferric siderophore reductase
MPKSSRAVTVHPMVFRELEVLRVRDVTPGMRRVTLTGAQLGAFTSGSGHPMAEFRSPGFDDDIRLHFPYPGQADPVLPVQLAHRVAFPKDGPRSLSRVYIEIAEDAHRQELRALPGVTVHWLSRAGAEAGTTSLLLDVVRAADWWDGAAFAWVAGEQAAVRDIRRHLVEDRNLAKATSSSPATGGAPPSSPWPTTPRSRTR